jgi:hypothetical protein
MLKPLVDHTKLLTSKVESKGRLTKGPLDIVQKHKNKKEKIFYRLMLVVATTQTPTP